MCDSFMVPEKDGEFFVEATIAINGDALFTDTFQISIRTPDLITLVQTDKPIYKPGETSTIPARNIYDPVHVIANNVVF